MKFPTEENPLPSLLSQAWNSLQGLGSVWTGSLKFINTLICRLNSHNLLRLVVQSVASSIGSLIKLPTLDYNYRSLSGGQPAGGAEIPHPPASNSSDNLHGNYITDTECAPGSAQPPRHHRTPTLADYHYRSSNQTGILSIWET